MVIGWAGYLVNFQHLSLASVGLLRQVPPALVPEARSAGPHSVGVVMPAMGRRPWVAGNAATR